MDGDSDEEGGGGEKGGDGEPLFFLTFGVGGRRGPDGGDGGRRHREKKSLLLFGRKSERDREIGIFDREKREKCYYNPMKRILRKKGTRLTQAGFTLVELLVVVTIIGLLVGLVSVAVPKAIESGMKAKAKGELTAIVAAVKAYKQEYGRWPVDLPNGVDDEDTEARGTYSWCDGDKSKTLMKILCASPQDTSGLNPKAVRFLEGPTQDGTFVDPWSTQYIVKLDTNDSNSIEYYGAGNKPNISLSVIALSFGPRVGGQTEQLNPDDPKCKNIFSWR